MTTESLDERHIHNATVTSFIISPSKPIYLVPSLPALCTEREVTLRAHTKHQVPLWFTDNDTVTPWAVGHIIHHVQGSLLKETIAYYLLSKMCIFYCCLDFYNYQYWIEACSKRSSPTYNFFCKTQFTLKNVYKPNLLFWWFCVVYTYFIQNLTPKHYPLPGYDDTETLWSHLRELRSFIKVTLKKRWITLIISK